MAGEYDLELRDSLESAFSRLKSLSGSQLKEYSILAYVGIFIVFNIANATLLAPTGWTVYEPYEPDPENDAVLNDNSPEISAYYWDEDGDSGTLSFYDLSGGLIDSCSVTNGSQCGVEWGGASAHDNDWYAVAEDDEGDTAQGPDWYFLINNPPNQISSPDNPSDGDIIYSDSVELSVTPTDPDGDTVNVEFLNNVSNASESDRTAYDVNDGKQASVQLDLNRGNTYNWWVEVSDNWDTTETGSWSFYVNSLPDLDSVEPVDGSVHTNDEIILNATASDEEQTDLTMYFFDRDDNLLGKESGVDGEQLSSDNWDALELGNTYTWKVNVSDGYGNATYFPFSFITSASEEYRIGQSVDIEYSSIISSPESSRVFNLEVENRVSTPKEMITYLEGVNAVFNDNGESSIEYRIEGYETREFLVTVQPESPDEDAELRIISENTRIGVNTTEVVPAVIREVPQVAETRDVPGIAPLQLAAIMLLSVLLYYQRL